MISPARESCPKAFPSSARWSSRPGILPMATSAANAAMVLAKDAEMKPRDLAELLVAGLLAVPGVASAEIAGQASSTCGSVRTGSTLSCRPPLPRERTSGGAHRAAAARSTSNTSPPIPPDPCMSAIAAARSSATRWRLAGGRGLGCDAGVLHQRRPALRSTCSPARPSSGTVRRLGEDIGAIPEGLYPGDYLKPVGAALAASHGGRLLGLPRARVAYNQSATPPSMR